MRSAFLLRRRRFPVALLFALLFVPGLGFGQGLGAQPAAEEGLRPMTFLDVQLMARAGSWSVSPDGKWILYTVSTPDWEKATRQTDLHLVSVDRGLSSSRQLTFTDEKNEDSPRWSRDGSFFVFTSNRDAPSGGSQNQLYLMRPDGGEARRITDAKEGVSNFDFSKNGRWLVFRSGKAGEEQLWRLPVDGIASGPAEAEQMTKHPTGVRQWEIGPDSRRIYFLSPDTLDPDEKLRTEKRFTVEIKNQETPLSSLWALEMESLETVRLTNDSSYDVTGFTVSPDGKWVGFTGGSTKRFERNITSAGLYADLYLLETATGHVERLTDTYEAGVGGLTFSPDGRWVAFSGPDDMTRYTMTNNRVYIREVGDRGEPSARSATPSTAMSGWASGPGTATPSTSTPASGSPPSSSPWTSAEHRSGSSPNEPAALSVNRDEDTGVVLVSYTDPMTPPTPSP
jgi:Tol biopolymer transport system component